MITVTQPLVYKSWREWRRDKMDLYYYWNARRENGFQWIGGIFDHLYVREVFK